MSITFNETALQLITQYRQILRKNLDVQSRQIKLNALGLNIQYSKSSDIELHKMIGRIIKDIKKNTNKENNNYYSYQGIVEFSHHLEEFLDEYIIKSEYVVHKKQLTSRAILESIQTIAQPDDILTSDETIKHLVQCNKIIASYGSDKQHTDYINTLREHAEKNPSFFNAMIKNFEKNRLEIKKI